MRFTFKNQSFVQAVETAKETLIFNDLRVVAEIPTSQILAQAGFTISAVHQILFFRPDFMYHILSSSPENIMKAPLKLVLLDMGTQGIQGVFQDPESVFFDLNDAHNFVTDMQQRINLVIMALKNKVE